MCGSCNNNRCGNQANVACGCGAAVSNNGCGCQNHCCKCWRQQIFNEGYNAGYKLGYREGYCACENNRANSASENNCGCGCAAVVRENNCGCR